MDTHGLYACLALVFSFIFSGAEIAFLSTNKLQFELQGREGLLSGRIMAFFARHPAIFFGTSMLGNVLALLFFVYFLIRAITSLLPASVMPASSVFVFIIVVLFSTLIIVLVTYLLPKCLTIARPDTILRIVAVPYAFCAVLLFPLVYPFITLFKFIVTRLLKIEYAEDRPFFDDQYRQHAFYRQRDSIRNTFDHEIFYNAIDFKNVKIRECMVPRTEITAVEVTEGIESLKQAFVESGHSKIMVFKKTIDDIIGYCHSSALFKKPATIQDIVMPIIMAPQTTPANELMIRFIQEKKNVAVVMDEFGGTAGIVSIEDIIEEIFGEVDNEPNDDNLLEQQLDGHTFLFSGRLEIDYLNKTYNINLPTGDYDTLGGLILSLTENLPPTGEVIRYPPFVFTIQSSQNNRIENVKITVQPASDASPELPDDLV
jgi:putative hemolysin